MTVATMATIVAPGILPCAAEGTHAVENCYDANGTYYNHAGRIPPVVHQFNRVDDWTDRVHSHAQSIMPLPSSRRKFANLGGFWSKDQD